MELIPPGSSSPSPHNEINTLFTCVHRDLYIPCTTKEKITELILLDEDRRTSTPNTFGIREHILSPSFPRRNPTLLKFVLMRSGRRVNERERQKSSVSFREKP